MAVALVQEFKILAGDRSTERGEHPDLEIDVRAAPLRSRALSAPLGAEPAVSARR